MEGISFEELVYYRNLLSLKVGDKVEWIIGATPCYAKGFTNCKAQGVITNIFPNGLGAYTGKHHAFMTVTSPRDSVFNYSVLFINPTLKKLETDK